MFDSATLTICGNVVADPKISGLPDNPSRVSFRVVSTHRRRDPDTGTWVDAGEYAVNVVCWRNLARGVAQSLRRGDPVVVTGRIAQREYIGQDGERHWFTEVTADFVGHDLAKGASLRFYRFSRLDRLDEDGQRKDAVGAGADAGEHSGDVDGAALPGGDGDDDSVAFGDAAAFDDAELAEPELSGV